MASRKPSQKNTPSLSSGRGRRVLNVFLFFSCVVPFSWLSYELLFEKGYKNFVYELAIAEETRARVENLPRRTRNSTKTLRAEWERIEHEVRMEEERRASVPKVGFDLRP